ncbi:hypothetical protein VMCG_05544 [Cytospora schulzeri]|uniref:Uncharacterized protein n=1 Tax=Cytospora schulzeri TaxID=448051 RepID=A0A423WEX3_9PEZI|nr:hypothetical protein VMCG_05544 [Valsa malicola]
MSSCRKLPAVASSFILHATDIRAEDGTSSTASYNLSLEPAVTQVATTGLFQSEALQLTDPILTTVHSQLAAAGLGNISFRFRFRDNGTATTKRGNSNCKTYADDSVWPSDLVWFIEKWSGNSTYSGKAIKMGSGVQSLQAYVTIVGGEGESVGIAGGFMQGGGHSPMAGNYGLAADQVAEFDVVTADGRFLTSSDDQNDDLFWALRVGGVGTFGV